MLDTVDVGAYLASLIFPGGMICDDCVDTPEGAAAAHRADMMLVADPNEY